MKKEGSTASMLWLDIRRGFCSKRFWGIVGVVTIVFVVFLTLDIIYPLQKYYNGYGTFDWKLDSISMAPFAVRIGILSMDLFVTFFPFIGVIAYAGTISYTRLAEQPFATREAQLDAFADVSKPEFDSYLGFGWLLFPMPRAPERFPHG